VPIWFSMPYRPGETRIGGEPVYNRIRRVHLVRVAFGEGKPLAKESWKQDGAMTCHVFYRGTGGEKEGICTQRAKSGFSILSPMFSTRPLREERRVSALGRGNRDRRRQGARK